MALVVRKGGCSIEEKAIAASTLIYPPNIVKYIIVDGEQTIRGTKEGSWEGISRLQDYITGDIVTFSVNGETNIDPKLDKVDSGSDEINSMISRGDLDSSHPENHDGIQSIATDEDWPPISSSIVGNGVGNNVYSVLPHPLDIATGSSNTDEDTDEDWPNIQSSNPAIEDDGIDGDTPDHYNKLTDEDWPPALTDDSALGDGATAVPTIYTYETTDDLSTDDESYVNAPGQDTSRALRHEKRHNHENHEKIRVAILHVSYTVGYDLLDMIMHETTTTRQSGGSKVIMDNKEPPTSGKTIFLWVLLSASFSASACCCLLLCVNRTIFEDERPPPPPQPVRRRLTYEQVRANHPAFFYHEGDPTMANEIDCAICLDEFTPGDTLRRLPCQHVFHGTCIARWLIERSAVCPLCKVDLYEEEDDSSSSSGSSNGGGPNDVSNRMMLAWWGDLMARRAEGVPEVATVAANDALTPQPQTSSWSFWGPRQGGPDSALEGGGLVAPTALPTNGDLQTSQEAVATRRSSSWWPFSSSRTAAAARAPNSETDTNNLEAEPAGSSNSWVRMNWFGGRRRRQQSEARLTELTEPLLPVSSAISDGGEGSETPAAEETSPQETQPDSVAVAQPPPSAFQEHSDSTTPSQETPTTNADPLTSNLPPTASEV